MTVAASWNLQQAIYSALLADTGLSALVASRIYDDVPQDVTFPYVTLGEVTVREWNTASDAGAEHGLVLHAWSRAHGRKEVKEILSAINNALDQAALAVAGFQLINLQFVSADMRREKDGETYHGIIRFRAVTESL